ncbi:DUF167 domain-containing protein [Hyphococcus sp.]|jgi:hypothetical protein|uniref:DUF167 domain-containing protein n=1 Tax=Hyphococcus sp. TaxID=2038636 RepID=UPI003D0E86A5
MIDGGARLLVRASPGAKADAIAGLWRSADGEMRLAVKVAAPPDKGKANAAILKLLAGALGLPKSALILSAGETSRLKSIDIKAEKTALAAALDRLAQ